VDHAAFVLKYPPVAPRKPHDNEGELRQLGKDDGVLDFQRNPSASEVRAVPKKKGDPGCHLWVFTQENRPYILELAPVVPELESGKVKHSNLTGGGKASCGGEVWIDPANASLLYVNGCSGRYGPASAEQLEDASSVLRDAGFEVKSFGWDFDVDKPAMVLRP
jgi:hypothetical protein